MTVYRVVFSNAAYEQARTIDEWWIGNRPAAPDLFVRELDAAVRLLETSPMVGPTYPASPVPGVRRMLIGRSRYHVYWEVDVPGRTVTIPYRLPFERLMAPIEGS